MTTYDALRRLTSTDTDSTVDTQDAAESFTFDLASNRTTPPSQKPQAATPSSRQTSPRAE